MMARFRILWVGLLFASCVAMPAQSVDEIVEQAITASLLGDRETIADCRDAIAAIDAARRARGESVSGLLDNLETLLAASRGVGDPAFADEQRRAARSAGTPEERLALTDLADRQPWPTIQRLLWENRYNRLAGGVNWLLRRVGQILSGQTQAALQMVNDIVFSHRAFLYPTSRERKIHALAERVQRDTPNIPEAARAAELVETIGAKVERDRRRDLLRRCRLAEQQGQWELAGSLAEGGLEIWPSDPDFRRRLVTSDGLLGDRRRSLERSLLVDPVGEALWEEADWQDLGDAIRAMQRGDNRLALMQLEWLLEDEDTGPALGTQAEMLVAVCRVQSGELERGREAMEHLANGEGASAALAGALLRTAPFDTDVEIDEAMARRRHLTRRFVWQGARSVDDNLYIASSSVISEGLAAPVALGVLFFIDTSIRAVAAAISNPLGAEGVIDALARGERRSGALSEEQLTLLRDRLRDLGRTADALEVHDRLRESDPDLRRRLARSLARQLIETAESAGSADTRQALLLRALEVAPDSRESERAWRMLHGEVWDGIHLTRDAVRNESAALIEAGCPLPAELMDGRRGNGEIDEEGIWIDEDATVHWRLSGGRVWREATVRDAERARLLATAATLAMLMESRDTLLARQRGRVPLEITGSLGASGIYAVPQLQRFRYIDNDLPLYE